MSAQLAGRTALITGASQGLGLAIARAYVAEGASVMLCARSADDLAAQAEELTAAAPDGVVVLARAADVSDPGQLEALAKETIDGVGDLSILVSNAGVYGPMGPSEEVDWLAWVRAVEINLFGSVLAARAVIPHFKSRGGGKIIQISGGGATSPMPSISAYAASKAGVIRFAETLADELKPFGVDVNAIAPGALNTRLLDELLAAGPEAVGEAQYARALAQQESGGAPIERACDLAVWLASSESDGVSGKLIAALWDPWPEFQQHREDLEKDIYTLRRIVPADRQLDWGNE